MGITHKAGDSPENTSWVTGKQLSLHSSFWVKGVLGLSDCGPCLLANRKRGSYLRVQGHGTWSQRTWA